MHTLVTFPITRSFNSQRVFDDGLDHCLPPLLHDSVWGFIGLPSADYGYYSMSEAIDIFPEIFESGVYLIGHLAMNPKQPEW